MHNRKGAAPIKENKGAKEELKVQTIDVDAPLSELQGRFLD